MKSSMERYLELMQEYPHLFQQSGENGLEIITDPQEIESELGTFRARLAAAGQPTDWLVIGVLVEDPWHLIVRDLVRFPGGQVGGYVRRLNQKSLQGGFNVVILPRCGNQYLLLRHFRHEDRRWHWEFPRGYGEPGLTAEACAKKEIQEELSVTDFVMVEILREMEGPDGGTSYFLASIPPLSQIEPEAEEGISNYVWVDEKEMEEWISSGEFGDFFSLKAYLLAKLYDRNNSITLD